MKQVETMVRYTREFVIAIFAYIVTLIASNSILMRMEDSSPWRVLLAIVPVVPVAFVLHSIMGVLTGSDELQQKIQLLAISFAAGTTSLLTFAYGFLEGIGFPHLSPIWILPITTLFWGLGLAFFSRRYR
ncbi:MAG: hypothetical protein ACOYZ8_02550 [Chloroflexota bacterium]